LRELEQKLDRHPDYITLSGSGEPTLYRPLDVLLEGIRSRTEVPLAVLTNGSLLGRRGMARELALADVVIPSLDAGDEATFQFVNRPHQSISFERMLAGLMRFRRQFRQQLWLEVFLLHGYTDTEESLSAIRHCVNLIQPDRVQLNTVARPPCDRRAIAVPITRLAEIATMFSPPADVIAASHDDTRTPSNKADEETIHQLLSRRPCTVDDLATGLLMHRNEVLKVVEHLCSEGRAIESRVGEQRFYRAKPPS
jgi:wyosine [tRNA(Phe)-imidazoG37] synthetase (radical SAM superfamily)